MLAWHLRRDPLLKRPLSTVIRENSGAGGRGPIGPGGYRIVASVRLEKPAVSSKTSSIRENRGKGDISGGASRYEGFGGKPLSRRPVKQRKRPSPVRDCSDRHISLFDVEPSINVFIDKCKLFNIPHLITWILTTIIFSHGTMINFKRSTIIQK